MKRGVMAIVGRVVAAVAMSVAAGVLFLAVSAATPTEASAFFCPPYCDDYCIVGWGERLGSRCESITCCSALAICCQ